MKAAWAIALAFTAATLVMLWPLPAAIATSLPHDYGDPLYVAWALAWVGRWTGRLLTEGPWAAGSVWDANILAPEPQTLALSDHFFAQGVLAAPVYWFTANPILAANLSTLSTFVLSGLGGYLLVYELTRSRWAGVMTGCVLAFNSFRLVYEITHLQMLSTQWMPFVLFGLRRHFDSGRLRPLVGAAVAAILLHWSAGYFVILFPPFVALYILLELALRGRLRDVRVLSRLFAWAVVIALCSWPFVEPYVAMQARLQFARQLDEIVATSAAIDAYVGALPILSIPILFALAALIPRGREIKAPSIVPWALVTCVLSFWLSLGPLPRWGDATYPSLGLYRLAYEYVPGFDAVRVPSRFSVIFLLGLGVLAGIGVARRAPTARFTTHVALAALIVIFIGRQYGPLALDQALVSAEFAEPPHYLRPRPNPPDLYRFVASLPADARLAEFPFSDLWYNARYVYATTYHWRSTLNGFTSVYPHSVLRRMAILRYPLDRPEEAWQELLASGATHAIVHERAWHDDHGARISEWLRANGAGLVVSLDGAQLFALRSKK